MPKLKVALCIPAYGMVHAKWAQCLHDMTAHFLTAKLTNSAGDEYEKEVSAFFVSSSMLSESRHRLTAEATLWGADYILWMDTDHVFPADSLCQLWARNVDIVGCNYARRCEPTAPTAAKIVTDDADRDHNNLVYTTREKYNDATMEEVSHMGFGLCLMRTSIFDRLQTRAEELGEPSFMPLFMFELKEDRMGVIGEDVFFFKKCRDAGLTVWCDHGVSGGVGHIHETIVLNAHAVAQEQEWIDSNNAMVKRFADKAEELEAAA